VGAACEEFGRTGKLAVKVWVTLGDLLCQFGMEFLHLSQLGVRSVVKPKAHE
jgi:hypothetical protein